MPPHPQSPLPNALFSRAFTLVEMSIVISIIGLIIGGIILGKMVVRRAQINSVAVAEQQYVQAALQFQQKYGMLPGDFTSATTYWGSMTSAGLTCPPAYGTTNSSGGTLTCNGDGNGQVDNGSINPVELFLFWQHLANAQMIQGSYTGIAGSAGTSDCVTGTNVPQTRVQGGGIYAQYWGTEISKALMFNGNYGHVMVFGSRAAGVGEVNSVLTALEAQAFDSKYDDGLPATGNVQTFKNGNSYTPNCATTAVSSTAAYSISTTGPQCSLIFITGF